MSDNSITAIAFGLALLSPDDMRELLFNIATYDTNQKIEGVIEFSYFARHSITNKILERLHEAENDKAS